MTAEVSRAGARPVEWKAVAVAALGSISVGFVPMFVTGLQHAGVATVSLLLLRYLTALTILVPLALSRHDLVTEWKNGGRWLVLNAATIGTFQAVCYFRALETLPTSLTVTIFYCYPLLALAIDRFAYKMPITPAMLGAIGVIITGICLITLPGSGGLTFDARGLTFASMSAVGYALYIASAYPFTKAVSPIASAVFIYGAFAVTFGIMALITGLTLPPHADLWLNILFLGTFGGALQIICFAYALPRLTSSGYAVIVCLEVVTVVLAAAVFLGERLGPLQWIGIATVLGGIVIARTRRPAARSIPVAAKHDED